MDGKIKTIKLANGLDDSVKIHNLPLPALVNVLQLALDRLPDMSVSRGRATMPPEAVQSVAASIRVILSCAAKNMQAAPETPENDVQGAALLATIDRFRRMEDELDLHITAPTTH